MFGKLSCGNGSHRTLLDAIQHLPHHNPAWDPRDIHTDEFDRELYDTIQQAQKELDAEQQPMKSTASPAQTEGNQFIDENENVFGQSDTSTRRNHVG